MKKLLAMLCMITCIFGLTACGSEETEVSELVVTRQANAEYLAEKVIAPFYSEFMNSPEAEFFLENYNAKEVAKIMEQSYESVAEEMGMDKFTFDGANVLGAITSFSSGYETMGVILEYGEASSVVKDDTIVVTIPVVCEKKTGNVEVIFSNDIFMEVQSCSLNADMTNSDILEKASLNTLLGMGTVFVVLILIMAIIYAFGIIPKLQKKAADKKAGKTKETEAPAVPVAAPVAAPVVENLTDDLELVAVIAAAIAASEGAASTDGFVVRSIRRANRR